jgi:hypothetical protein
MDVSRKRETVSVRTKRGNLQRRRLITCTLTISVTTLRTSLTMMVKIQQQVLYKVEALSPKLEDQLLFLGLRIPIPVAEIIPRLQLSRRRKVMKIPPNSSLVKKKLTGHSSSRRKEGMEVILREMIVMPSLFLLHLKLQNTLREM